MVGVMGLSVMYHRSPAVVPRVLRGCRRERAGAVPLPMLVTGIAIMIIVVVIIIAVTVAREEVGASRCC